MKNEIKWSDNPNLDQNHDLCGKDKLDKFVDITHSYKGTWSVIYNNVRLKSDFANRHEARIWAENTDLIDYLSNLKN